MTPEQRDIFLGTLIQECDKFVSTTGKRIIGHLFMDTWGNRSPIGVLLIDKLSAYNLIMSSELSKIFGFTITPQEINSFNRGMEGSTVQHWDDPVMFAMGRRVNSVYMT